MVEEISQAGYDYEKLVFLGIESGGAPLARYLAKQLGRTLQREFPVCYLNITLYRDDRINSNFDPHFQEVEIPIALRDKHVILVDDVLFTGRTVRAALSLILSHGRPKLIRLAVAVDRGGHELPIRGDHIGLNVEASLDEAVRVIIDDDKSKTGIYRLSES